MNENEPKNEVYESRGIIPVKKSEMISKSETLMKEIEEIKGIINNKLQGYNGEEVAVDLPNLPSETAVNEIKKIYTKEGWEIMFNYANNGKPTRFYVK
jgi:hypothetical protein